MLLMPEYAFAHGQVGNRIFLSPILGNDAFPDNAATLELRRSDYEFSLIPSIEKQLTSRPRKNKNSFGHGSQSMNMAHFSLIRANSELHRVI
jgi:hypothetical protein